MVQSRFAETLTITLTLISANRVSANREDTYDIALFCDWNKFPGTLGLHKTRKVNQKSKVNAGVVQLHYIYKNTWYFYLYPSNTFCLLYSIEYLTVTRSSFWLLRCTDAVIFMTVLVSSSTLHMRQFASVYCPPSANSPTLPPHPKEPIHT